MSEIIEIDGEITSVSRFKRACQDEDWKEANRLRQRFKALKEEFEWLMLQQMERMREIEKRQGF